MGGIDLHIHSTASDGTLAPDAIVQLALQKKLSTIAITDHDTVGGIQQLHQQGIPSGIEFINGVEISVDAPGHFQVDGSLHLLGYGIDPFNKSLNHALTWLQESRKKRIPQIVTKLNLIGIPVTMEQVVRANSVAGRPHIATVLLEMGIVKNFDEAFSRYLGKGQPAYVERLRLSAQEAIRLIQDAGGIAVIAHPGIYFRLNHMSRKKLLVQLKKMGLKGIEVYYPKHSSAVTRELQTVAGMLELVTTGGTDFHGAIRPGLELGSGDGSFHVPEEIMPMFLNAIREARKP